VQKSSFEHKTHTRPIALPGPVKLSVNITILSSELILSYELSVFKRVDVGEYVTGGPGGSFLLNDTRNTL